LRSAAALATAATASLLPLQGTPSSVAQAQSINPPETEVEPGPTEVERVRFSAGLRKVKIPQKFQLQGGTQDELGPSGDIDALVLDLENITDSNWSDPSLKVYLIEKPTDSEPIDDIDSVLVDYPGVSLGCK
jgi:hypothetical protein